MYEEFAHLWPLISAPGDYADEARFWRDVLRAKLGLANGSRFSSSRFEHFVSVVADDLDGVFLLSGVQLDVELIAFDSHRIGPQPQRVVEDTAAVFQ